METINHNLIKYIETNILPEYQKNEEGHGLEHIKYVIARSLKFAKKFEKIDLNLVYAIAAFHDLAHHIDKDHHEIISAKIFYSNEEIKFFFNDEERLIIKEAIEDHRASLVGEPRSNYGKIVSTADRTTSISIALKRVHSYTLRHHPNLSLGLILDRGYNYIKKKYYSNGYAKSYVADPEYDNFLKDVERLIDDRSLFERTYFKVNNIDIKEKAMNFAICAHAGEVRKSEPDKPMVIHPISVAKLLEEYSYDDNVVAAGYLHDVVEDTSYTLEDIEKEFGKDIALLVNIASEPDKSLSWEERKKHTIESIKNLPLRHKLVVAADKINNLEELAIKFAKDGKRDFSAFKRGEESQKWYYTSVYQSLIFNQNQDLPIFKRLNTAISKAFNSGKDSFLEDTIFEENANYFQKLACLHACKMELQRLKYLCALEKPFVIEFTGTPRTGKTTIINNLYDYFKKGKFNVKLIEEFTTSPYFKEVLRKEWKDLDVGTKNLLIIEEVHKILMESINENYDIILLDRGLYDRQIWNLLRYNSGDIEKDKYFEARDKYFELSKKLIDYLVVTYTDSITSLKRDYLNSLSLEKRSFLTLDNIESFNQGLISLQGTFEDNCSNVIFFDTTNNSSRETSVEIASNITPVIRKKYIASFQKRYTSK